MSNKIKVQGLEIKEIMTSLSQQFDIDYTNDGDDYCIDLSQHYGQGYIRGIQFSHGLSAIESNITLQKKTIFNFEKQDVNTLQFLFNLDSSLSHYTSEKKESDSVSKLQHIMFSNDITNTHSIVVSKKKPSSFFILVVNRKEFEEKMLGMANHLSKDLELIFKDVNGVNDIYHKDYFSLEIARLIEEFKQCELEEFMKPMFLEGKSYEILTSQLQNFNTNDGNDKKRLLRKSTIDKIENAVEIIKEELDVRINVHQLAKRVGLNQNTLQNGFKNLFHTSVNEYIKNYRIDRAKVLIENSELNITEITYKIGINSRSYFSKLFKARFGISPSEYISQIRGTENKSA